MVITRLLSIICVILCLDIMLAKTEFPYYIDTYRGPIGRPDIRFEGFETRYLCRTMVGKSTTTLIFEQKRRGLESWGPVLGHIRLHTYVTESGLVFANLKFKADSKFHNGTTFRCLVKENPTNPKPLQFDPIEVHNLATARYHNVSITRNAEANQLTCDPPANVWKQSNDKWMVSVPIVNSITTDYRGRCLLNGKRFIDIRHRDLGRYDEPAYQPGRSAFNRDGVNSTGTACIQPGRRVFNRDGVYSTGTACIQPGRRVFNRDGVYSTGTACIQPGRLYKK
ncbi:uncharacterized protein LOC141906814 isoform X2 [Tubulanus polymorphus]|uniref:uncharacterized protein LOC141906814 isoform X2 n=1 Tax=Tubulanus polymorphus TaxID=672921 RepID=UPI003DA5643A